MASFQHDLAIAQRKTVRVKSVMKNIFLMTAFIEAFVRSSVEGEALIFFQTFAAFSVKRALQLYHLQVALLYCGHLSPIFTKKIHFIPTYWMLVLFTVAQVVGLVAFCLCLYLLSDKKGQFQPLWLVYIILGPITFGCKFGQMKQAMYRQYNLPREMEEYVGQLWHMLFFGTLGRLAGFVNMMVWRDGPYISFVWTVTVATVFLLVDITALLIGSFFARKALRQRSGTIRSESSDKRISHAVKQEIPANKDGSNKRFPWSLIKFLLPLYVPVILAMQYRFQKSSRFIIQAKELDLRVGNRFWIHPIFLNVFYPLTIVLLVYPYKILCDVLRKRNIVYSIFHKTMVIFIFMILSGAAATLVAVFVDDRAGSEIRLRGGAVVVYNALECPATIDTPVHPNIVLYPVSHVSLFSTENNEITADNGQPMRVEVACKPYSSNLTIKLKVERTKIQEYLLAANRNASNIDEAVLLYLGSRDINMEFFFNNYLKIVHYAKNTTFNVSIDKSWQTGGSRFYHLLPGYTQSHLEMVTGDRYSITANGMLLNEMDLEFGTSVTVLIAESTKRRSIPLSRVAVLKHPNQIPFYYQFPQIIFQGVADLVTDEPGFIYASNVVNSEWRDPLQLAWFLSIVIAQFLFILYMEVFESERQVYNFLVGFCICFWSTMYYWEIMKRFYKTDYDRENNMTSKNTFPNEDGPGTSLDHIKTN